jgi:serine/threonine-protein kinase
MPTASGAAPAAAPIARAGRISSDSIPVGGFAPGTILSDRYRIIGLLGRGGMGEVYRADDLKLGQPVALKFLPRALASDPVRRERFFAEVRITRQLAHPNICRVYDIAEFEGQHFLSMEYIDGEDLASLIKRIGYLPNEKALEITRQLIAGLAAAHDRGVLHRDLKPANIMIDGHGRVRVTDFGLAMAADDETHAAEIFGTPAYMAPEQFAGKGASVRSDIYALGLVLYEIYTGKRAFTGNNLAEIREEKERQTPKAPSEIRSGADPLVERLIMRSLDRDPRLRPASAAQLAAALPGGDPLAAAIAAGETPSPEMVAASGLKEGLRPAIAIALVAAVILGSIVTMAMNSRTQLLQHVPTVKPRDVLIERAQEIIAEAGYPSKPRDIAFGFFSVSSFLQYIQEDNSGVRRKMLDKINPVFFWYRQSPQVLEHLFAPDGQLVTPSNPSMTLSGEVLLTLDTEGNLRTFQTIPPQEDTPTMAPQVPEWSLLFGAAGLDPTKWTPTEPQRLPFYYADSRAAWTGSLPVAPDSPMRIEAAAYRGKPVSFEIIGPWSYPPRVLRPPTMDQMVVAAGFALIITTLIIGALFFARQNLRLGRGDRRGATRLAIFTFSSWMIAWLFSEHHVAALTEGRLVLENLAWSLFLAGFIWFLYIALEPFARRRWPQVLVSWTRVLSGQLADPLVGRDILIGCATGTGMNCLGQLASVVPQWFGHPMPTSDTSLLLLANAGSAIRYLNGIGAVNDAMGSLFLLFLLRTLLRSERLAAAVLCVLLGLLFGFAIAGSPLIGGPFFMLATALYLFVLIRFGLLAAGVAFYMVIVLSSFPMTLHTSAWYSNLGFAGLAVILAFTAYGFKVSLGNQPLLNPVATEE